ncbi:UNVERIFIED_CONTAM: Lysine-specific demethylase 3A [Siphonaria sp. JEL0065]|nr:Lysine-specific demethylase 3A [Siphonaria sp. JEL0065]
MASTAKRIKLKHDSATDRLAKIAQFKKKHNIKCVQNKLCVACELLTKDGDVDKEDCRFALDTNCNNNKLKMDWPDDPIPLPPLAIPRPVESRDDTNLLTQTAYSLAPLLSIQSSDSSVTSCARSTRSSNSATSLDLLGLDLDSFYPRIRSNSLFFQEPSSASTSKATKDRISAISTCSLKTRHSYQDFSFWTFIHPKTRSDILEYAAKHPHTPVERPPPPPPSDLPIRFTFKTATDTQISEAWAQRVPIVISGLEFKDRWDPESLAKSATRTDLIKCRKGGQETISHVNFKDFVDCLRNTSQNRVLKGFDYPIHEKLSTIHPTHWQSYKSTAPFSKTLMNDGPDSLFSLLPRDQHSQLHGPTLFIATETPPTDATTRIHKDGASAYNTLLHVKDPSQPGALWHIFTREDTKRLHFFNEKEKDVYPLLDFSTFLDQEKLKRVWEFVGVEPIVYRQMVGEIVLIPAGCAHQVRNLQECVKISQDVVSAECLEESIALEMEYRKLPVGHIRRTSSLATVGLALGAWERLYPIVCEQEKERGVEEEKPNL